LYCGFADLGRQGCHGLLKDNDLYNTDAGDSTTVAANVLLYNPGNPSSDALPASTINSVASFIALYEQYLAGGSPSHYDYNSLGAAATIDVMLGATGPDICSWYTPGATTCTWQAAVAYAQDPTHLADWVSRINYYGTHNLITWNQTMYLAAGTPHGGHACVTDGSGCWTPTPKSPPMTTDYDDQDVVMVREDGADAGIISVISFQNPDGSLFILNRICGNFEGVVEPIVAPPPATVSCAGMTIDTAAPDPNHPFTLKVAVQYNPASATSSAFGPDNIALQLTGPAPYKGYSQSVSKPDISNGVATATFTVPATGVSGTFDAAWRITGSQAPTTSCSASVTVAYQPYFDVVGGDVSVGQGFGAGCTDDTAADIKGYNMDSGGPSPNYFGAGTSQAAIATGIISGFASNTTNDLTKNLGVSTDSIAGHLPAGLIGSNSSPGASNYGGNFLGSYTGNWCMPDYVSNVAGTADYTAQPDWSRLTPNGSGYIVRLTGDQTLGNIQLPPGVRVTVVVTGGSVYINGNITYGSYSNFQNIPQFNLLVSNGNIYIDPSVSELHGFYDAQPGDDASGGQIFTCANGNGLTYVLKNYAQCSTRPLVIYGAVAANQVVFGRTTGNIAKSGAVSDVPAERIVYTPELWLGQPSTSQMTCSQNPALAQCMYQSYTSLPPTL
jgi:hypothetical protein